MIVRFHVSATEEMEQFDYDDMDFVGMDESEIENMISQDLKDWVEQNVEYDYDILEE